MTIREFLSMGHTSWLECFWSIAQTETAAKEWFHDRGHDGQFYRMCHTTIRSKNSDGFFAYWMPVK